MASGDKDREALSKLLQIGTVAEYENEFVKLSNRVMGISQSLLKCFYISGLKLDLQCLLLRSNPKTLDEAFSLTRAAETRFANLDIWEFLRSNPLTLGEDFFKARITEDIVEKKIDVIIPLRGEFASLKAEGSLNVDEYIGVEEVVADGEALKVGDDEFNRVISTLKNGGGEFDSHLDGSVTTWVAEGERMVLCDAQGSGRLKRKKFVGCSSGRQKNYISGRRHCGMIRIWDPGITSFSRHHLEGKVNSKEWGMIHLGFVMDMAHHTYHYLGYVFRINVYYVLG